MSRVLARLARGARRVGTAARRLPPLVVLALVLVVAVAGTAVGRLVAAAPSSPVSDEGDTVRVGVHDGDAIPAYAARSRAELAALPPGVGVYALVSLSHYVDPAALAPLLAGVTPIYAYTHVPVPGRQTDLVRLAIAHPPDDLVAAMRDVATRMDAEAADSVRRADRETDPRLRALDRADADLAQTQARAYRTGCACVYSAVVRGDAAALRALAGRAGVRVVDPAPEVTDPAHTVFTAPLPEQLGVVTPPSDTVLPPD